MLKTCSVCGRPARTSRCPEHPKPRRPYGTAEYKRNRAQTLLEESLCWRCGKPAKPGDPLTADHVVPVAAKGPSLRSNLRAAHKSCNSRRGAIFGNQRFTT